MTPPRSNFLAAAPLDRIGHLRRDEAWLAADAFRADATSGRPPFTIAIPPPNVTGVSQATRSLRARSRATSR